MAEDGHITREQANAAKAEPLGVNPRVLSPNTYAAGYFAEEVRRELNERYGEKKLYEGGLSVRTTLDPKMQLMARKALVNGLVSYDEAQGFRGAMRAIDVRNDWGKALGEIPALGDVHPWRLAVVLEAGDASARIGLQPPREKSGEVARERETGTLAQEGIRWTRKTSVRSILQAGDVIYVEPVEGRPGQYRLRQIPDVSGAIVAMDPYTGRVFAMVGGFSYDQSVFNRATQALRQPGLRDRARQWLHAVFRRARRADRDRARQRRSVAAGKLRRLQRFRAAHAALRHRALEEPDDRAAGARRGHAADRRILQALRHLRRHVAGAVDVARRRRDDGDAHDRRLFNAG
jgi:hypothetical protein